MNKRFRPQCINASTFFSNVSPTQRSSPLSSSMPQPTSAVLPPPPPTPPPSSLPPSTPPLSMLPPSNVINALQPSNVTLAHTSYSASIPLPTMLSPPPSNSLPPYSITLPPSFSLPPHTCHRTSESIGFEAHPSSPQMSCAQSIRRQWPSGATGPQSLACPVTLVRIIIVQGTSNSC